MTAMTVTEREHLGQRFAAELAPQLRSAINRRDAGQVAELILGLDRQELLALVVVLASEWPTSAEKPKRRRTFVFCRDCGKRRRHESKGRCGSCHGRWDDPPLQGRGPAWCCAACLPG